MNNTFSWFMRGAGASLIAAAAAATLVSAANAQGRVDQAERSGWSPYAIGLWGDLPYSPLQETVGVPNLIDDMNAQRLAFSVHDGDLKQGSMVSIQTTDSGGKTMATSIDTKGAKKPY